MANGNTNTPKGVGDELKDAFRLPTAAEFAEAYLGISEGSAKINKAFGQTRQRIVEIQTAIADTSPGIARLGGNVNDVTNTISELAQASRRNVIANTEDVEKMFAAQKILGGSIKGIADSFLNVGVGISQIPKELEKAITYVQSIGGNTEKVMSDVQDNMEQMNRFQFEGGVQGLTKMAAQASMLRFDMSETFRFADKVLDPEGAINMASAFQRLGVSAGALADPFQLMNQSINDPSGLQTSLANVAKQFTEFDEKTKTFKINPQGVLTLREMEKEAGLSTGSLSKMGLAAAELDKRLSSVNAAGLHFENEDDKQYLQNIASMGKSGKYEVELKDGTKKELQNLNQEEFDALIEQQKNGPKDLEGIARSQMTATDIIKGDVNAIRTAVTGGLVTQQGFLKGMEGARNVATGLTGNASKELGNTGAVRETVGQTIGDLTKAVNEFINNKDKKPTDVLSDYLKNLGNQGMEINKSLQEKVTKILEKSRNELGDDNAVERTTTKIYDALLGGTKANNVNGNQPISSLIEGTNASSKVKNVVNNNNESGFYGKGSSEVKVIGGLNFTFDFKGGAENLSPAQKEELLKMFADKFNSTDMQQFMINATTPNNPTKANYGARVGN
jgi:hypothetical protein